MLSPSSAGRARASPVIGLGELEGSRAANIVAEPILSPKTTAGELPAIPVRGSSSRGEGAAAAAWEGMEPAPVGKCVRRSSATKSLNTRKLTIDVKIGGMLEQAEQDGHLSNLSHPAEETCTPGAVSSVWGKATDKDVFQPYFSGKAMNFDNHHRFGAMPHSIGLHCQRGHKPNSPNQDDFFVLERKEWLLLGVLDGHGVEGHHVSHFAQQWLPKCLLDRFVAAGEDWDQCAHGAFGDVAAEMRKQLGTKADASGTTASVALLSRDKDKGSVRLRCAFVGDSTIVYGRRRVGTTSWEATKLGEVHRPDREDEQLRIEKCNGKVRLSADPKFPSRLVVESGSLAMSRSLGDFDAERVGLTSDPEIPPETVLEEGVEHMVIACSDGIWDVIDPLAAVQIVAKFSPEDSQRAAEKLAAKAQLRWQEQDGANRGMVDDITAIVVRPGFDVGSVTPIAEA